jgi:hypothetical protein
MSTRQQLLQDQRQHLAGLVEAIQLCLYFLDASAREVPWPLSGEYLEQHKKDNTLFEALAAVNERFAKLQDTLGSAMRHSLVLSGEQADSFIKVLALFEKQGVIASIETWQLARTARNLAAHDYETDYLRVAEHFNTLHSLVPEQIAMSARFVQYCADKLNIGPLSTDFAQEFAQIAALPPQ